MQRLFVAWPATPPPRHGYPVVYVLDGNAYFHTAVQAARALAYRPELTEVDPAVIVGIGYPTDEDFDLTRRTFDDTPAVASERLGWRPNGEPWPPVGGADAFVDFIETRVKASVEAEWPIDRHRQSLFGHSFGGLLVLYIAFTLPGLFRSFLASSPSIWFADRIVLTHETGMAERMRALGARRDLMISVGDQEQTLPENRRPAADSRWLAWLFRNRMVDNAREMAGRLSQLADSGLDLSSFVFEDENHVTAPPLALGKGLRIALRPRGNAALLRRNHDA